MFSAKRDFLFLLISLEGKVLRFFAIANIHYHFWDW